MIHDSKAYGLAYDAYNAAFKVFDAVRIKYRAGLITDADFLSARRQYDVAIDIYDKAFAVAQDGGYSGGKA